MTKTPGIFASTAPAYYARGIPVIPLYARDKRPVPEGWSYWFDRPVDPEQQAEWLEKFGGGNIGVVLGPASGLSMLDVDTEDAGILALIQQIVPVSPWRRVGKKGFVMAFRYNGHKTFRIKTAKGETICELLSDRTQVVLPPSIHPDTQMPYEANCELLDVIDQLPRLDPQIEAILRGALKDYGLDLSISGSSRVTDFVSRGARDTALTEKAGLFAYAVMRGERSVKEAVGMLRSYNTEFVEQVAGDPVDVEKHVTNLVRFLRRDVLEKGKQLPVGWDDGLTEEEKQALGLEFDKEHEQWTYEEMRDYLRDEFEAHPSHSPGRVAAVEKILHRMAASGGLTALEEGRLLQYIADVASIGARVPTLRQRLRELRSGEIQGTDHAEIAKAVLSDLQQIWPIRRHGGDLWAYKGSHWEILPADTVMARIAQDYGSYQAARRHSDHRGIYSVLLNIAPKGLKMIDKEGVNFANGFLDTDLVLHPHDPDYGMTYTLPFRYMPGMAGNSPHFFQFLEDCWGEDEDFVEKRDALQEALCVTLFGMGPRYQRVILLQGVAKSGKSQLLKIAQSLVPDDAKCFVPPNEWSDRFLPTQMYQKLINVCGELSEKKKIDGQRFKDIVDGAEMSGQFKGRDIFKFRPMCTHWFASNHTPKTDDTSEGFNRRWLILEFRRAVPPEKRRIDLGDLIVSEEREAIVAWAVLGLGRLLANNEYTRPASHDRMIRDIAQDNNSVRFFLETSPAVRIGSSNGGSRTTENRLYRAYWTFCFGPAGVKPVTLKAFRGCMREMEAEKGFRVVYETNQVGLQEVMYHSITLVNEAAA